MLLCCDRGSAGNRRARFTSELISSAPLGNFIRCNRGSAGAESAGHIIGYTGDFRVGISFTEGWHKDRAVRRMKASALEQNLNHINACRVIHGATSGE